MTKLSNRGIKRNFAEKLTRMRYGIYQTAWQPNARALSILEWLKLKSSRQTKLPTARCS